MEKNNEVPVHYKLLGYSIFLFLSLGLIYGALVVLNVSAPLAWWIVLFVIVGGILFGSSWYLGLALWFAMKMKSMAASKNDGLE